MLLGAAGGMYVAKSLRLPYDARVEYLTPIAGESAFFDTRVTSLSEDVLIDVNYYYQSDSFGRLLGANGDTNLGLSVYFDGSRNVCTIGGVSLDLAEHTLENIPVSLNCYSGYVTAHGVGRLASPCRIVSPLYVFAASDAHGVLLGSYAHNVRLNSLSISKLKDSGGFALIHRFIPVRAAIGNGESTGALYDSLNTSGGPLGNGLYVPIGGKMGYGQDLSQGS